MSNLVSTSTSASSPGKLFIKKPRTVVDSSDEARTDTATPPSMNPSCSPVTDGEGAVASTKTTKTSTSLIGRRRKADKGKIAPKQRKYERKTKRFVWPDDLHRLFVAAIFDVGLKNASPKTLLTFMESVGPDAGLTTEHLKSHLQKYRLNYERSRMEFLDYYDYTAKRNLKRRRSQAQQRGSGASSETASMFVFPISNPKRQKSRVSDSDGGESDSDTDYPSLGDNRMDAEVKTQTTPRDRRGSPATPAHKLSYSQLMQSAQQQPILDESSQTRQHSPIANTRLMPVVPTPGSTGMMPIAPRHLPPAYAAHVQRKQVTDHDRELAVAAAAVAAYRYPLGQLPVSNGMPELSDPQWSFLTSLMSPQLAGMTGPEGEGGMYSHGVTSEAMPRNADGYMFHDESSDLRMQMHLAMQAQMNLHRQMLTRKVEVAQHLASQSRMRENIDSTTVANNNEKEERIDDPWGSPPHLQQHQQQQTKRVRQQHRQQQQQQHQHQHQHQHQRSQQYQQQEQQHQQYGQQHHQYHQYQLHQHLQQDQQHYQQLMALPSRPSLSAPNATSPIPATPSDVPVDTTLATSSLNEAMIVSTSVAENGTLASDSRATGLAAGMRSEGGDDGMDLYRWDRIDLNVELDDDDLFGFLKS